MSKHLGLLAALTASLGTFGDHAGADFLDIPITRRRRGRGKRNGRITRFEFWLAWGERQRNPVLKETPTRIRSKKGTLRRTWRDNFERRATLRAKKRTRPSPDVEISA